MMNKQLPTKDNLVIFGNACDSSFHISKKLWTCKWTTTYYALIFFKNHLQTTADLLIPAAYFILVLQPINA